MGNLNAKRDWGHAKDYVEAMYLMLQQEIPEDYVIATGKQFSVREFCEAVFKELGVEIVWKGSGVDEKGIDKKSGERLWLKLTRVISGPTEVESLLATRPKQRRNSDGKRRSVLKNWLKKWWRLTLRKQKRTSTWRKADLKRNSAMNSMQKESKFMLRDIAGLWDLRS